MNEKCGVASGDQQEFIFGGTETGDHAYPWMAGLAYKLPGMDSANVFCGGVIISSNVIATAGHCLSEVFQNSPIEILILQTKLIRVPAKGVHIYQTLSCLRI